MSDEIRTPAEALEAAARVADSNTLSSPDDDYDLGWTEAANEIGVQIRALAARIPERDDEALEELILAAMIDAPTLKGIGRAVLAALREAGALK